MKNKGLKLLLTSFLISTSCTSSKSVNIEEYKSTIDIFKELDQVKILQLTDIHFSFATDYKREEKFLRALVKKADPDIIVTTGDNILGANTDTIDSLLEILDSLKNARNNPVYWAITWGNHDRQGIFDPEYPSTQSLKYNLKVNYSYLNEETHYGLYKEVSEDDVYGRSNYYVDLTDGKQTYWRLYMLDSNCDYYVDGKYSYDAIDQSQIEWVKKASDSTIPSLMFFHIPLFQLAYSYDNALKGIIKEGDYGGELREKTNTSHPLWKDKLVDNIDATRTYPGYKDSHLFDVAKNINTKGIFFGHDHINDFWALYDDEATIDNNPNGLGDDILIAYGTKTTDNLYFKDGLLGGNLIRVNKDQTFDGHESEYGDTSFQHIYLSYDEVEA